MSSSSDYMANMSILMVDDERHISAMTRDYLQAKGFEVDLRHHANDVLDEIRSGSYSLCILDVNMPMKNGFALAREIREVRSELPIIFLTGKTDVTDRVTGLKIGAEDYITKPYSLEELELRIRIILRRIDREDPVISIGHWTFEPAARLLYQEQRQVNLTTMESELLHMFCTEPDGFVNRFDALRRIWNDDVGLKSHNLKVYISKLRKYFHDDSGVEILNIHGQGYRLVIK